MLAADYKQEQHRVLSTVYESLLGLAAAALAATSCAFIRGELRHLKVLDREAMRSEQHNWMELWRHSNTHAQ
jgi:hypothetical protein